MRRETCVFVHISVNVKRVLTAKDYLETKEYYNIRSSGTYTYQRDRLEFLFFTRDQRMGGLK